MNQELGMATDIEVVRVRDGVGQTVTQPVASEVPCTIIAGDIEVATLLCSPGNLKELAAGFLFTSGFIAGTHEIRNMQVDKQRWCVYCDIARPPDPDILNKRMYTAGCGRGVVYATLAESGLRAPLESSLRISSAQILAIASWLQRCSPLFRETGGVHTAALSDAGELPGEYVDDIGRHNAVDKAIGARLLRGEPFSTVMLVSSGRVSSEILQKARRAGIAVILSRGAPTHQTVLRARDMGISVVGFARSGGFTVYSHKERIILDNV